MRQWDFDFYWLAVVGQYDPRDARREYGLPRGRPQVESWLAEVEAGFSPRLLHLLGPAPLEYRLRAASLLAVA